MKKTIEEIQKEMNQIDWYYRQTKVEYQDWYLKDKMRYGRLLNMKQTRMDEWVRQTNKEIRGMENANI
jgi:hypothetical protein